MKFALFLFAILLGSSTYAQIPEGTFSGFASNTSFDSCRLNRATVGFSTPVNGQYQVRWLEEGFFQRGGFCESRLDATFTPDGTPNRWRVNFFWRNDIIFGKAVLVGDVLTITGRFSGMNNQLRDFEARMQFSNLGKTLSYNRTVEVWSGPSMRANGTLHRH
jgi:hypothetical protein